LNAAPIELYLSFVGKIRSLKPLPKHVVSITEAKEVERMLNH